MFIPVEYIYIDSVFKTCVAVSIFVVLLDAWVDIDKLRKALYYLFITSNVIALISFIAGIWLFTLPV